MKRLLVPLLLLPGVAMAGLQIVNGLPKVDPKATPAVQSGKVADLASLTIKPAVPLVTPVVEAKRDPVAQAGKTVVAAPVATTTTPALAKAAPVPVPVPAAAAAPAEPVKTWRVTVADGSIRAALERWTKEAGYQLFWEVPNELEQSGHYEVTGTFEHALNEMMALTLPNGYPTEAIIYDGNKAVRVVKHIPQEQ